MKKAIQTPKQAAIHTIEDFAKGKTREVELKLSRMILYVEISVFIAVALVGLMPEFWLLESVTQFEIGLAIIIAIIAAYAPGLRLWGVYGEIKRNAANFVEEQRKKILDH